MKIEFIDLKAQQSRIRDKIENNIKRVLDHGQYIMGPEVSELEENLAAYVGAKYCIGVSSGTDALLIAMMALGIGPGDEVITSPFTFIATGEMIALLGAKPVFVDIDERTYNLAPSEIEKAVTSRTRAIMPVSLYGQCADLEAINQIAGRLRLPVIEDAAQSFGATHNGKRSCGLTTIGCTSFFPSKPLGGYGDSGACFTNDDELARSMKEIRVHGQDRRYHHAQLGINGRMDTLQAAILLVKLEIFNEEIARRQAVAAQYNLGLNGCSTVIIPHVEPANTSVYAQYTLQSPERDKLIQVMGEADIPATIHYPITLTGQPCLSNFHSACPVAESVASRVFSIPMHPYLDEIMQNYIIKRLLDSA